MPLEFDTAFKSPYDHRAYLIHESPIGMATEWKMAYKCAYAVGNIDLSNDHKTVRAALAALDEALVKFQAWLAMNVYA